MKALLAVVIAGSLATDALAAPNESFKKSFSSFDLPAEHAAADLAPAPSIHFENVDLDQVLNVYGSISGRTVIHGALPDAKITFKTDAPVNRIRLLQLLDTVLAQNNIAMVLSGDDAVKVVPAAQINSEAPPEIDLPWSSLPESSSVMTRTVHLKNLRPSELIAALQPFAKLPNSLLAIDSQKTLVIRDYSANIRQELKLIDELEKSADK